MHHDLISILLTQLANVCSFVRQSSSVYDEHWSTRSVHQCSVTKLFACLNLHNDAQTNSLFSEGENAQLEKMMLLFQFRFLLVEACWCSSRRGSLVGTCCLVSFGVFVCSIKSSLRPSWVKWSVSVELGPFYWSERLLDCQFSIDILFTWSFRVRLLVVIYYLNWVLDVGKRGVEHLVRWQKNIRFFPFSPANSV